MKLFLRLVILFFVVISILATLDVLFFQKPISHSLGTVSRKPSPSPSPIIRKMVDVYGLSGNGTFKILSTSFQTEPPGNIVTPIFGGNIFYYADASRVMRIIPETSAVSEIYQISQPHTVIKRLIYGDKNMLYVLLLDTLPNVNPYSVAAISLIDNSVHILGPFVNNQPNGSYTYLFSSVSGDVVYNYGEDGCDSGGQIYLYSMHASTFLLKTGGGCNEDPYLVGGIGRLNSLVLASQIPQTYPNTMYDMLYLQDVTSGTKTSIFDLKKITDKILSIHLDDEQQHAIVITDKGFVLIDLQTGEANAIASTLNPDGYLTSAGGKIYLNDSTNLTTDVIDVTSASQNTLLWQSFFGGATRNPIYLGTWNNEPLLMTIY